MTIPCPFCTVQIPPLSKTCPSCEHRLPKPRPPQQLERLLERQIWRVTVFQPLADWFVISLVIAGLAGQLGAFPVLSRTQSPWGALAGTSALCLGLALHARLKFRSGAWGLLGVLSLVGAGIVLLGLRHRCLSCGGLMKRSDHCPRCNAT